MSGVNIRYKGDGKSSGSRNVKVSAAVVLLQLALMVILVSGKSMYEHALFARPATQIWLADPAAEVAVTTLACAIPES